MNKDVTSRRNGHKDIEHARSELRLVIAGSVDDGKSTLVGRLLHDTKSILADQYEAVATASRSRGADAVDLSLLTDGLRAEREQGITIDVAYRYFSTPKRSFILADTPGHVQYTRNTLTGASTAQAAVILVDVRAGISVQTRRHAAIMALLRVPYVLFAVNKMDAVGWDEERFKAVAADLSELSDGLHLARAGVIPMSALTGENVVTTATPGSPGSWYTGQPLLTVLEELDYHSDAAHRTFRMPVQLVIRPRNRLGPDYRGLAGRISAGTVTVGNAIIASPGGQTSTVTGIDTPSGPVRQACAGESVTLLVQDDLDIGRGQIISLEGEVPTVTTHLRGVACWLDQRVSVTGQRVLVKSGTSTVRARIPEISEHWDVDAQEWIASSEPAGLNSIVRVHIELSTPVAVDDFSADCGTGGFLVIDPADGATVAVGMVGDLLTGSER